MRALDLFAGAGGWDLAAERLGIHADGVEIMKEARATREAAGLSTPYEDVWLPPLRTSPYDGLIASPPCQTFSQAGKGKGRRALDAVLAIIPYVHSLSLYQLKLMGTERTGDERTALVLTPLWYALNFPHKWIAWEQVPTVLPVWEACATELRKAGYSVWTGNMQAEMYGVPQTRKRAILMASKTKDITGPPTPTHSRYYPRNPTKLDEGVKKWVSMAEALGWQKDFTMVSNYGTGGDPAARGERRGDHPAPTITSKIDRNVVRPDFLRMTKMANSAVRHVDEPAPTIAFGHDAASARWFKGDEWMFHRPSTTIVGTYKPEIVAAPGYRTTVSRQNAEGSVRVTVQEAGILQSFPVDYPWQGAKGKQFLQCGNAIPPLLAEAVLQEVTC